VIDPPAAPGAIPMSRARARSSRRILDAARAVIDEKGLEELSMRRLAEAADVSVRTIYNVFGDKHGVVTALVQRSFEAMDAAIAESGATDALERIWETVSISVDANCRHMPKAIVAAVVSQPALNAEVAPRWRGRELILDAVESAYRSGTLRPDISQERLVDQAGPVHAHRLRQWAHGDIDDTQLHAGVLYAYDTCLLAVARPAARARLLDHLGSLEPSMPPLIVHAAERSAAR
jgi:AcrR family transcriptional regulator